MKTLWDQGRTNVHNRPHGKHDFFTSMEYEDPKEINAAMFYDRNNTMYLWARDVPDIDKIMYYHFGMIPVKYSNTYTPRRGLFGVDITYNEPATTDRITVKSVEHNIGYKLKMDGVVGSSVIPGYKIESMEITDKKGDTESMGNILGNIAKIDERSESHIKSLIWDIPENRIQSFMNDMDKLALKDIELKTKMPTYIYG